ncbi:hypothetical protein E4U92_13850 [Streptomyces galbus]|uniref:Uncharacterized protein n=1 Tax=Streptomyces galbus TaxID=33898 RepID=A0A4U5X174_STRGB|nr:hypothetical protein E4U92_13850 [Streptomyces galbus]
MFTGVQRDGDDSTAKVIGSEYLLLAEDREAVTARLTDPRIRLVTPGERTPVPAGRCGVSDPPVSGRHGRGRSGRAARSIRRTRGPERPEARWR